MILSETDISPDFIKKYEKKIYSQNEEDGVIEYLFKILNVDYTDSIYVEIGTEDGKECNSRYLREMGMNGFMFDNMNEDKSINLYKKTINSNNLKEVLNEFNLLDKNLSLFSIDVDSFDYWIFKEALSFLKPNLFVVERNDNFGCTEGFFPNIRPLKWVWLDELCGTKGQYCYTATGLHRCGAGYVSLDKVANENGYFRVYSGRVNLYYIHQDFLPKHFKQPVDIWALRIESLIEQKKVFKSQNGVKGNKIYRKTLNKKLIFGP
jgi:hypothetical protein